MCANARGNFPELRDDIFMRSINQTYVGKTYSHKRIIVVCADLKFETLASERIYYSLIFYRVRVLFYLPFYLECTISNSKRSAFFGTPSPIENSCQALRVAVTWSCIPKVFGIYNFQRSSNDRLIHGFSYELSSSFAKLLRWFGTFHHLSRAHLVFVMPSLCCKAVEI